MSLMTKIRQKLKLPENQQQLSNYRQLHREHDKKFREKKKQESPEAFKKMRAEQRRNQRKRKLAEKENHEDPESAFKHSHQFSKAVKTAEDALPSNPTKARLVIRKLAVLRGINLQSSENKKVCKIRKNFVGTSDCVVSFFELDLISRQLPGRKDFIINDDKEKIQKRAMIMTGSEAHKLFTENNPAKTISLQKFLRLRPKHVALMRDADHKTCCCIYCENMTLCFNSFSSKATINTLKELLQKLVCNAEDYQCISGRCENCREKPHSITDYIITGALDNETILMQWQKNGNYTQKIAIPNQTIEDSVKLFSSSFRYFIKHKYLIDSQRNAIDNYKKNQNADEAVIIMDYSQNFSTTTQNEVQSAFFAQRQISIFTAVAYVGQKSPVSFVIVNDDISHAKEQVWYYEKTIIKHLKENQTDIKLVRFCSDGCAAQFKNKFTLSNLIHGKEDFDVCAEWHFTPTSHGKSAADGLGGMVKRNVYYRVLTGKYNVYDAKDFYNCAKDFGKGFHIFCVSKEEINDFIPLLQKRWAKVKTFRGTREFHYFAPDYENKMMLAGFSSLKDNITYFKL